MFSKISVLIEDIYFNPFQNKSLLLCVCSTCLENTAGKGDIVHNATLFSAELSVIFNTFEIVVCKLFQFGSI